MVSFASQETLQRINNLLRGSANRDVDIIAEYLKKDDDDDGGDKDHHNIDIDPLPRRPSLTPDRQLLKVGLHGAISSDLEVCSNLTINEVLLKFPGSNAADAAVTQALCKGMVNFFNSGIGGGGYVVFSGKDDEDHLSIDFREKQVFKVLGTFLLHNSITVSLVRYFLSCLFVCLTTPHLNLR